MFVPYSGILTQFKTHCRFNPVSSEWIVEYEKYVCLNENEILDDLALYIREYDLLLEHQINLWRMQESVKRMEQVFVNPNQHA